MVKGKLSMDAPRGWARWTALPRLVRSREWIGVFQGHEIRVVTRGIFRARLLIDGECPDRRSPLVCTDRSVPFLTGRLSTLPLPGVVMVYVYSKTPWAREIEVRAAGRKIVMNLIAPSD